ncbi:MAG: Fic family protein [Eubacteriales bacterium]|nr:Fic family protein [Clostridiales bacterium]MDY5835720.1 Fic family protein [Eubacteriales bacterium]
MDVQRFTQILRDPHFCNLKKMQYKYSQADVEACLVELRASHYLPLPLRDFKGQKLVYLPQLVQVKPTSLKLLYSPIAEGQNYSAEAMEEEIFDSLRIENISANRASLRKIVTGSSSQFDPCPAQGQEAEKAQASPALLQGMKEALDLISQPSYKINTQNLHQLYQLAIGPGLSPEKQLPEGSFYRDDEVYVVGNRMGSHVHRGLAAEKLPSYMADFLAFAQEEDEWDPLLKAAVLHFYLAYLHPYFDGNGRTARLFHLWYLVQAGFPASLFVSFSSYIEASKKAYYQAFQLIEQNQKISGVLDVSPFLTYFVDQVYNRLPQSLPAPRTLDSYQALLRAGQITAKERDLWNFILSFYGFADFSSKELERDFGQAAYATIYKFLKKFTRFQLLIQTDFSSRPRYKVKSSSDPVG